MAQTIPSIGNIVKPDWYQDPLYQKTQDQLYNFGSDILSGNTPEEFKTLSGLAEGNIPDYYKSIGEAGGADFMNMLNLTKKNTVQAVNEDLVRRGVTRGGIGASVTSKAIADTTAKLTYADYQRALSGKQNLLNTGIQAKEFLMGTGTSALSGVRSAALDIGATKNQFGLGLASIDLGVASKNADIATANAKLQADEQAQGDALWEQILASSIGAIGTIGGAYLSKPKSTTTTILGSAADYASPAIYSKGSTGMAGFDWNAPESYRYQ